MKQLSVLLVLTATLMLSGCTWLSTKIVPAEVLDTIARGDAVAQVSIVQPPTTQQDIADYYRVNAALWRMLAEFYGLRKETTHE